MLCYRAPGRYMGQLADICAVEIGTLCLQGLRHADENGGGGTGISRQRSQDFLQGVTHIKNRKLSGFGPLFS